MSVSVIVPVYNVAPYLRAGLDSLLAQSRADWSAICVDDGSTDESGAILDEYAARDPRFVVVHQEHAGVSAARNAALDRSTGDVILFLDPDDTVTHDWVARMHAALDDAEWALTGYTENGSPRIPRDMGALYTDDAVRRRCWRAFFGYRLRDVFKAFLPGGMWRQCGREMAGVWRCAVRRAALGTLRFDTRLALYEDAMFLAKLGAQTRKLAIAGDCGYGWAVRPRGAMTRQMRENLVRNKFAVRDVRQGIDPGKSAWRGTFVLSALEVLRATRSVKTAWRYLRGGAA